MPQPAPLNRILQPALLLAALAPLAWLAWKAFHGTLGEEPVELVTATTGDWAMRFLLLALSITPIRRITGWHGIIRLRRTLGLLSFFYALLHLATYIALRNDFNLSEMGYYAWQHPEVFVGAFTLLLLTPLALTSSNAMVKRLGGNTWNKLHQLVYVAAAAAMLHYLWPLRSDIIEPIIYTSILFLLIGYRLWWAVKHPAAPAERVIQVNLTR